MAEQRRPGDAEMERALVDLGARLAYPPTPPLAGAVRARLAVPPARPQPWWTELLSPRRLALALLVLVILAGALLAISPSARSAIADRLGLRGVTITQAPPSPAPSPAPVGTGLQLGEQVTLAEARARMPFAILIPSLPELGLPDEAYVRPDPPGGQVALVYRPRQGLPQAAQTGVGLLLTQFRGEVDPALLGKTLGPGTRLERVTVNGEPGFWIEGTAHVMYFRAADGEIRQDTIRLAGNTLLWEQGELTLRLESALSKDEALRIAGSVR